MGGLAVTIALMGTRRGLAETSRGPSWGFQEGFLEETEPVRASKDDGSWLWGHREQHVHRLVHESMGALGAAAGPVGKGWGL